MQTPQQPGWLLAAAPAFLALLFFFFFSLNFKKELKPFSASLGLQLLLGAPGDCAQGPPGALRPAPGAPEAPPLPTGAPGVPFPAFRGPPGPQRRLLQAAAPAGGIWGPPLV